jgi:formylglycine-generating enzyme required for sulfatase activity
MQYVDGQTLAARLRRGDVDLNTALSIAVQISDALVEAHTRGILHRDIKPANIMLTTRGDAKVMDFGLAKPTRDEESASGETMTDSLLSAPGAMIGTVPYMSPEQVRGEVLDPRSDLFSLGVLLYEMLCGRRPFDDSSQAAISAAILTREPLPMARFAPAIPAELERIVFKALRKDPDERYQTAKDLLLDLRALKDEQAFQVRLERAASTPRPSAPSVLPDEPASAPSPIAAGRRRWPAIAVMLLLAAGSGAWFLWHNANQRWAVAQVAQVTALAEARRYFEAYDLAVQVEKYRPGDPAIDGVMPTISYPLSVTSDPPGASVFLRRFNADARATPAPRQPIGITPITNLRIARGEYILSIEKDGYAGSERALSGVPARAGALTLPVPAANVTLKLQPADVTPPSMVFVPGGDYRLVAWSRPTDDRVTLNDFFIDKYEVSNNDFKQFISAGGYIKRDFWKHRFMKDGVAVSHDDAMRMFVDRSGLPGPREWSNQNPPDGKGDHPVTGITWYEAAAYAAFRDKQLPTVFQWEKAARNGIRPPAGAAFMPWGVFHPGDALAGRANFGTATLPTTSSEFGMSQFGAYNMAGNVAEWMLNDSSEGFLATGGAWGDATYAFAQYGGRPGFYSSNKLGFRLARNVTGAAGDQGGDRIEIAQEIPAYEPTPAAVFQPLAATYRYEKAPLDARIEESRDFPDWKREKITFDGANGERVIAYLYLPHHFARPLQVLHYIPAGDVNGGFRSLTDSTDERMAPYIKSGRAVFGVVLKGYSERLRPPGEQLPDASTVEFHEAIVARITDLRRGLDYLETRTDLDRSRIGMIAPSAGAVLGLLAGAVEPRYRAIVMIGAGLPASYAGIIRQANPIYFASHIKMPKLILQGRYDEDTPLKTATEPLFKVLVEPKRLIVYEGGHVPTVEVSVASTQPWLDETLGRVQR